MHIYQIRNTEGSHVAISDGFIGGKNPGKLKAGEVWVPNGPDAFSKMLKASAKAAARRFNCSVTQVRTDCIGQPG